MPYPAAAIANEFIKLARESNKRITPMKLQKLVYFAHGWYLALTGKPLINEPVQAWKLGPVIPSLYHALKHCGNEPITECLREDPLISFDSSPIHEYSIDDGPDPKENELAKQFVKRIWNVYGGFTAVQLSNLTHLPDAPWSQTADKDKRRGVEIDQDRIKNYFASQAKHAY